MQSSVFISPPAITRASAGSSARRQKDYPGTLIVVEGIDGSGKSTQLYLLKRWLEVKGYKIHFTEWNSSTMVKSATKRGKRQRLFTPATFSLIHATDFADRCERQIIPLLRGGYIVLADRYIYTAFARDAARGCPQSWLRNLYSFAPVPDITFFFRAPLEVCLDRILSGRPLLKYYEAGMDIGLSMDPIESFKLFQGMILDEYDKMVQSDRFVKMDGKLPVNQLQKQMRAIVQSRVNLEKYRSKS
ncbi:thymidylate kinase [Candidatus Sumerlaeota bacterium]|nr:thymidylate kinase [Candidatus Sumerlaeota bacterium]